MLKCVFDVDGDADGDVELVWQRDLFCFSADRLATSKPCGDVKSLDSASAQLSGSHQLFLQHGSEESAGTDSDQNGCELYTVMFSCLRYI